MFICCAQTKFVLAPRGENRDSPLLDHPIAQGQRESLILYPVTSGILNRDPIRFGACAAMVNGALDGFVKAAALEMPRGIRINVISPTVLAESMVNYADYFRGFLPVPASTVALAYSKSVEGLQTGQVYTVPQACYVGCE